MRKRIISENKLDKIIRESVSEALRRQYIKENEENEGIKDFGNKVKKYAKKAAIPAAIGLSAYGASKINSSSIGTPDYNKPGYQEELAKQKNHQADIPIDRFDLENNKKVAKFESRNKKGRTLKESAFDAELLEDRFNEALKQRGGNYELQPNFFKLTGVDEVLAASNTTCIVKYRGRKYYAAYNHELKQYEVEPY